MFVDHSYLGSNLPTQTRLPRGVSLSVRLDYIPFTTAAFGLLSRHGRTDDATVRSTTGTLGAQARGPSGQGLSLTVTCRERGWEMWHVEVESFSSSGRWHSKCKGERLGLRGLAEGSPVGN